MHEHGSDLVVRKRGPEVFRCTGTLRHCHYRLFGDQALVPVTDKYLKFETFFGKTYPNDNPSYPYLSSHLNKLNVV